MLQTDSPHGAEGASSPLPRCTTIQNAVTRTFLQRHSKSCRDTPNPAETLSILQLHQGPRRQTLMLQIPSALTDTFFTCGLQMLGHTCGDLWQSVLESMPSSGSAKGVDAIYIRDVTVQRSLGEIRYSGKFRFRAQVRLGSITHPAGPMKLKLVNMSRASYVKRVYLTASQK